MDFRRMIQVNRSTEKTRPIRRIDVAFRRVSVAGGKNFKVCMDMAAGETAVWIYEVEGDLRLDFRVDFCPASPSDGEVITVLKATRGANAWSYVTPVAGRVQLQWKNAFSMASTRVLLFDWHK